MHISLSLSLSLSLYSIAKRWSSRIENLTDLPRMRLPPPASLHTDIRFSVWRLAFRVEGYWHIAHTNITDLTFSIAAFMNKSVCVKKNLSSWYWKIPKISHELDRYDVSTEHISCPCVSICVHCVWYIQRFIFFFVHTEYFLAMLEILYMHAFVCVCVSLSLSLCDVYSVNRGTAKVHSKQRGMVCLLSRFGWRSVFVHEKENERGQSL